MKKLLISLFYGHRYHSLSRKQRYAFDIFKTVNMTNREAYNSLNYLDTYGYLGLNDFCEKAEEIAEEFYMEWQHLNAW